MGNDFANFELSKLYHLPAGGGGLVRFFKAPGGALIFFLRPGGAGPLAVDDEARAGEGGPGGPGM